jgi:CO/xanthine dehydrogenase Mo-binding subunit
MSSLASPVGQSVLRAGGRERVTGGQRYAADLKLEDVLEVKLMHVSVGHARIDAVDTTAALAVEGVRYVLTAAGLPRPVPRFGPAFRDRPLLATGEVKYFGEPVAAVAADTEDAAAEAVDRIRVDYEELPGVYSIEDALADGAPLVQDPELRPGDPLAHTNVLREHRFGWGDVESAGADLVVQGAYCFPMVSHFSIEPFAALSAVEDGVVTVWTPIQHPFVLQRVIADALELPVSGVRVVVPDLGGSFGGKAYPKYEPLMAYLALALGRPVRLVLSLEESFQASRRAACRVHLRSGFDADGRLRFQDVEADFMIGAYADIGDRVVSKASYTATGPYRTPHARIRARSVLSHTPPSTAFRGFGVPQLVWALESQLDEAAQRLEIDRVELRLRNLAAFGDDFIPNDTPADGRWDQALRHAAQAIDWGRPRPPGRGRGIAMGLKSSATVSLTNAVVRLHADGSATVFVGTTDMGQGARTVLAQVAAHELGVPLDGVRVVLGDTASVPFDTSTSASRSSVFAGNAIRLACEDIRAQLRELADELDGPGAAWDDVDTRRVLRDYFGPTRGELIGVGRSRARYRPDHPLGGAPSFWEAVAVGCEVEVDEETGEILIHRLVTVSDVGKAINPQHVQMQDEGAAVMALGHTLMERLIVDEHGLIRNLGALDYRVPTTKDLPLEFSTHTIENEDGPGPYGAKGAGESGILAVAPAVAAAVRDAVGVAIKELPLTPERVWRALQEQQSSGIEAARYESNAPTQSRRRLRG